MLIDCDLCLARDMGVCGDCVVTFILPMTSAESPLSLDEEEVEALQALAAEGLVPRLRMVSGGDPDDADLAG